MADHNHLIASKLTQQVSCLESIAALLDDELTAIAAKRGEGLKSIAQQKISLLQQIQTIDKDVQKLVAHNGFTEHSPEGDRQALYIVVKAPAATAASMIRIRLSVSSW